MNTANKDKMMQHSQRVEVSTAASVLSGLSGRSKSPATDNTQRKQSKVDVALVTNMEAFRQLKSNWLSLEANSSGAIFFQSWHWNDHFITHSAKNPDFTPFILTASKLGRLVATLPMAIHHSKGCRLLTGLSEPYQQYTDMLCEQGIDPKSVFKQWLPLIKSAGVDYMHLGQVREDSTLARAIKGIVKPSGENDAAPFVQLSEWANFEDYFKSIKLKTRKNMRNARNRLEKTASISHEVHTEGQGLGEIIDRTFEAREAWLERMGLTSRAFSDADFVRFLSRFKSDKKDPDLKVMATSLKHGKHAIADQWGFIHKNRYYAFIAGWDEKYEQSSPGKLHLGAIIEECYKNGIVAADFMIPAVPYKATWAKNAVGVQDYVLPLTTKGYLFNNLWLNFLRPLAKTIAYKLSPEMRAKIFKLLDRDAD
ncbi:MAG: GNAT family N-acetyltransferase [Rhizobiaceae bacterium]